MNYQIEKRVWKHESPPGAVDYRGQERWVVIDEDGIVYDHFEIEDDAREVAESLRMHDQAMEILDR